MLVQKAVWFNSLLSSHPFLCSHSSLLFPFLIMNSYLLIQEIPFSHVHMGPLQFTATFPCLPIVIMVPWSNLLSHSLTSIFEPINNQTSLSSLFLLMFKEVICMHLGKGNPEIKSDKRKSMVTSLKVHKVHFRVFLEMYIHLSSHF